MNEIRLWHKSIRLTAVYIYEGNNWGVVERKFTFPNE